MAIQDLRVRKLLEKHFHVTWEDITGDPDAGKSNQHEKQDKARELTRGIGRSNVQIVILTPNGRLLHAITGYAKPKELHFELMQALASWQAVKAAALTAELAPQRKALVVRQDDVQAAWRATFGPKGKAARGGRSWQERQAAHDREIVREHPLIHAGTITTRLLTGGPGTHFGYGNGGDKPGPSVNEVRRRIGAPPVRETEADKRVRERREAARKVRPAAPRPVAPRPATSARSGLAQR